MTRTETTPRHELIRVGTGTKLHLRHGGQGLAVCGAGRSNRSGFSPIAHVDPEHATEKNLCGKCFTDGVDTLERLFDLDVDEAPEVERELDADGLSSFGRACRDLREKIEADDQRAKLPALTYTITLRFCGTTQVETFSDAESAVRWAESSRLMREGLTYTLTTELAPKRAEGDTWHEYTERDRELAITWLRANGRADSAQYLADEFDPAGSFDLAWANDWPKTLRDAVVALAYEVQMRERKIR